MPNLKVISNTTPIIALSSIGQLELLKKMYGKVYLPQAVYDEIMIKKDSTAAKEIISNESWILKTTVNDKFTKQILSSSIHIGEAEVIALANEIKADLVILDDYLARQYAEKVNIKMTGTIRNIGKS